MPTAILGGNVTLYYAADNNRKQVKWTGSSRGRETINALYSAIQSNMTASGQGSEEIPIQADTPTIYRWINDWFADDDTIEHFTGGSCYSDKWIDGTTEHILVIGYTQTTEFDEADIGRTIVGATTADTGTILDFNTARQLVWIRPDDPLTAGDEFDNGTEAYSIQDDPFSQVWQEDNSLSAFVDETTDANSAATADWQFFIAGAGNLDACYMGYPQIFSQLTIDIATPGAGTYTVTWEYWDGSAWTALSGVTDGTTNFKAAAGLRDVTYTVPSDWAQTSVNGSAQLYYIRAIRDAGTVTTDPVGDQGFVAGVGAGSFSAHTRHGSGSAAGESAWVGVQTELLGALPYTPHVYIYQEDPDTAAQSFSEVRVVATKGTNDWWGDGNIDIMLKVKEADSIFGERPAAASTSQGTAIFLSRPYGNKYGFSKKENLPTAGGNTAPAIANDTDIDNTTGYRTTTLSSSSGNWTAGDRIQRYTVGNFSQVWQEDDSGGTFVDETTDANDVGANDWAFFPAGAGVDDRCYFGASTRFNRISIDVGTAGTGTYTIASWEYWDGTAWTALTNVTDNTTDLKTAGVNLVDFDFPVDWAATKVNTDTTDHYYIRAVRDGGTVTLDPLGDEGDVHSSEEATGVITSTTGSNPTITLRYFLIGEPLTDFLNTETINNLDDSGTGTIGTPANFGPALNTTVTVTAGATTEDINNGSGPAPYSHRIDPATIALTEVYEVTKLEMGWTADAVALQGEDGEEFIGAELQIEYNTQTGAFVEGERVWDTTTKATGIIAADHDDGATGDLVIKSIRGTFTAGNIVGDAASGPTDFATIGSVRAITPVTANPAGTFAGGIFFLAPGWCLTTANLASGDEQAYRLVDDDGVAQNPPDTRSVGIGNLETGDSVWWFDTVALNGAVDKTQFTLAAGNNLGDADVVMDATIPSTTVTNANSKLRLISANNDEHRYRYDSYATTTFTLSPASTGTDGGTGTLTTIVDGTATFVTDEVEPGDLVRNTTDGVSFSEVVTVDGETTLTVTDNGVSWASQAYSVNTLVENYTATQNAFVPRIERIADTATETNQFIFSATFTGRAVVRRTAPLSDPIEPFSQDVTFPATGSLTTDTIRNADTIVT